MTPGAAFVAGLVLGLAAAGAAGWEAWRRERETVRHVRASFRAYLAGGPREEGRRQL